MKQKIDCGKEACILIISGRSLFHVELDSILSHERNLRVLHSKGASFKAELLLETDVVILDYHSLGLLKNDSFELLLENTHPYIMLLLDHKSVNDFSEKKELLTHVSSVLYRELEKELIIANLKIGLQKKSFGLTKPPHKIHTHDLLIDTKNHLVFQDNNDIKLTNGEMRLLIFLIRNKGAVVTKEELFAELLHSSYIGQSRAIDWKISTLRNKLGDKIAPYKYIKTIRGVGYRFTESLPIEHSEKRRLLTLK